MLGHTSSELANDDDGHADLARALLEKVIQGPELDLIWETYQDEGEDNDAAMDVDDEEVEAQKIANDAL